MFNLSATSNVIKLILSVILPFDFIFNIFDIKSISKLKASCLVKFVLYFIIIVNHLLKMCISNLYILLILIAIVVIYYFYYKTNIFSEHFGVYQRKP